MNACRRSKLSYASTQLAGLRLLHVPTQSLERFVDGTRDLDANCDTPRRCVRAAEHEDEEQGQPRMRVHVVGDRHTYEHATTHLTCQERRVKCLTWSRTQTRTVTRILQPKSNMSSAN